VLASPATLFSVRSTLTVEEEEDTKVGPVEPSAATSSAKPSCGVRAVGTCEDGGGDCE